ncbi:MAG: hydroxymethylbilane synthase [Verrucomicrobiota bacterium JB022]|nr:hydroxymethylbilane synthase [Verrucomicrobiota bacterium JB022]
MSSAPLRLATRQSPLAMAQAELAAAWLGEKLGLETVLLPMTTTGDERLQWSLEAKGGKGLFTSELENALLNGEADLAVHSCKDLPTDNPAGLALGGFLPREDARDVLVHRVPVERLKLVATGSPRRREQLRLRFPHLQFTEIRGNVGTRMRKILEGQADATMLAMAGLKRLSVEAPEGLTFEPMSVTDSVPAAGQGAIALQCRVADVERFAGVLCAETARAVTLERRILAGLGGGCHSATAAHYSDGWLRVFHAPVGTMEVALQPDDEDAIQAVLRELHRREA